MLSSHFIQVLERLPWKEALAACSDTLKQRLHSVTTQKIVVCSHSAVGGRRDWVRVGFPLTLFTPSSQVVVVA